MEDGNNAIASKVQELSDLELAALLCFVAEQHCCIIEADQVDLDNVQEEIKLVRDSLNLGGPELIEGKDMRQHFWSDVCCS
jgi:hypothetical protein